MKKYISLILVFCLIINLIGCYSMQDVTRDEFRSQSEKKTIYLWTQKQKYSFRSKDYSIENDTIIGYGKTGLNKSSISHKNLVEEFTGRIPLSDVKKFEMEKFDLALSLILIVIPVAIIIYVAATFDPFSDGVLGKGSF